MNKEVLKRLIKEVITDNRKNSILLENPYLQEAEVQLSLEDVLGMLRDPNPRAKLQRYFVLNLSKQDLIDLGKQFGQAAVIGGEKLIRNYREGQPSVYFALTYYQTEPDGSEEPAFGPQEYYAVDNREVVVAGPEAQAKTDYFSAIGGKKFVIPFFSDAEGHEMGDETGAFSAEKSFQSSEK